MHTPAYSFTRPKHAHIHRWLDETLVRQTDTLSSLVHLGVSHKGFLLIHRGLGLKWVGPVRLRLEGDWTNITVVLHSDTFIGYDSEQLFCFGQDYETSKSTFFDYQPPFFLWMKFFTYWSVESLFSRLLCNVRMILFGERYVLHIHSLALSRLWLIGYTEKDKKTDWTLTTYFFVRLKVMTWNITIFKHIYFSAIICTNMHPWLYGLKRGFFFRNRKKLQLPGLLLKSREKVWDLRFTNTEESEPGIM